MSTETITEPDPQTVDAMRVPCVKGEWATGHGHAATHWLKLSCGCLALVCVELVNTAIERSMEDRRCPLCNARPARVVDTGRI